MGGGPRTPGVTGVQLETFAPAASPPDGYPDTLPFIPDCMCVHTRVKESGNIIQTTMMLPDAAGHFAKMAQWHGDAGWTEGGTEVVDAGEAAGEWLEKKEMSPEDLGRIVEALKSMPTARFLKDGRERTISLLQNKEGISSVNLSEKQADGPE